MKRMSLVPAAVVSAALVVGVSACSSQGVSGSRHTTYDSFRSMAADGVAVVVGKVTSQYEDTLDGASPPHTVSVVEVTKRQSADGLATTLTVDGSAPSSGDVIEVRQLGGSTFDETPAPILEVGGEYLLFLTPSGLEGDRAGQYFVTGGDAGLFTIDGDEFEQLTDSADRFPTSGELADLGL